MSSWKAVQYNGLFLFKIHDISIITTILKKLKRNKIFFNKSKFVVRNSCLLNYRLFESNEGEPCMFFRTTVKLNLKWIDSTFYISDKFDMFIIDQINMPPNTIFYGYSKNNMFDMLDVFMYENKKLQCSHRQRLNYANNLDVRKNKLNTFIFKINKFDVKLNTDNELYFYNSFEKKDILKWTPLTRLYINLICNENVITGDQDFCIKSRNENIKIYSGIVPRIKDGDVCKFFILDKNTFKFVEKTNKNTGDDTDYNDSINFLQDNLLQDWLLYRI
jgi:hypothetical protein